MRLRLAARDPAAVKAEVAELAARRKATQPTSKRTFGSVFKNPGGGPGAGRLIEEAGLKGTRVGGAVISSWHANFIENAGGACSARRARADGPRPQACLRAKRNRARAGGAAPGRNRAAAAVGNRLTAAKGIPGGSPTLRTRARGRRGLHCKAGSPARPRPRSQRARAAVCARGRLRAAGGCSPPRGRAAAPAPRRPPPPAAAHRGARPRPRRPLRRGLCGGARHLHVRAARRRDRGRDARGRRTGARGTRPRARPQPAARLGGGRRPRGGGAPQCRLAPLRAFLPAHPARLRHPGAPGAAAPPWAGRLRRLGARARDGRDDQTAGERAPAHVGAARRPSSRSARGSTAATGCWPRQPSPRCAPARCPPASASSPSRRET